MSLDVLLPESYLSGPTNYAVYAEASIGDNGDPWGTPEYDLGSNTGSSPYLASFLTWDEDPSDGIESSWVGVEFSVNLNDGTANWSVAGGWDGSLQLSGISGASIESVEIRTIAQIAGVSFQWSATGVHFSGGTVAPEDIYIGMHDQFGVNTMSGGTVQQQSTTFTPAAGHTQMDLLGMIRIQAAQGVWPSGSDLFSQVLVYTA